MFIFELFFIALFSLSCQHLFRMDDIELMDVKASADYLRVSTSFLYQLVGFKKIKHIRIGSKIMFTKQILNEFLLSKIVEGGNNERKGIYL